MNHKWKIVLVCLTSLALPPASVGAKVEVGPAGFDENVPMPQREALRELDEFKNATISLSGALEIAEALHTGSITADISFDGSSPSSVYIVRTFRNGRILQDKIDAMTGKSAGDTLTSSAEYLSPRDRENLNVLGAIGFRMSDAIRIAENSASGRAISAGMTQMDGAFVFVVVVVSNERLKQVVLQPPRPRH